MIELKEITKLCKAYANSTKVPTFVINSFGKTVGLTDSEYAPPNFCRIIQESCRREEECCRTHLYGSYQAERFGEAYIFFCPYGLVHWIAPIMDEYQIVYSLVAGPVLMSSLENALIEEVLGKSGLTALEVQTLYHELDRTYYLPPNIVNDMARLLFAVASHLSRTSGNGLSEKQEFFQQQASIATVMQTIKNEEQKKNFYPLEKERDLIQKIRVGDKTGAQEVLNEIFGYLFFSQGNDLELIKTRVIELVVLLSRAAMEGGADNEVIFGLNYKFLREINNLETLDEIAFWLSKVMARFTDNVFNLTNVKNIDIIYKVVTYLRANYMKEISLEKAAKVANLSPSYFSKVFKDEMKCNFNVYLNNLRVENSKKFLLDDGIPLVDVAGIVGFQDQSYYTKVFKKIVGLSPGEFRKSRGFRSAKEAVK